MAGSFFSPGQQGDPGAAFNTAQGVDKVNALFDRSARAAQVFGNTMNQAQNLAQQQAFHFNNIHAQIARPAQVMGGMGFMGGGMSWPGSAGSMPMGYGGQVNISPMQMIGSALGGSFQPAYQGFRPGEIQAADIIGSNFQLGIQTAGLNLAKTAPGHAARILGAFGGPMGMIAGMAGGALIDTAMPGALRSLGIEYTLQREQMARGVHRSIAGRAFGEGNLISGTMMPGMKTARRIVDTLRDDIRSQQGGILGIESAEYQELMGATFDISTGRGVNAMLQDTSKGTQRLKENFRKMREVAFDLNMTFADLRKLVQTFGPLEGEASQLERISSTARQAARRTGFGRQAFVQTFFEGRDIGRQAGISGNVAGMGLANMAANIREQFSVTGQLSMDQLFRFGGRTEDEATRNFARAVMTANLGVIQGTGIGRMQLLNAFNYGSASPSGTNLMQNMMNAGAGITRNMLSPILAPMDEGAMTAAGPGGFTRSIAMMRNSAFGNMINRMARGDRSQTLSAIGGILGRQIGQDPMQTGTLVRNIINQLDVLGDDSLLKTDQEKLSFIAFREQNPNLITADMSTREQEKLFQQSQGDARAARALRASGVIKADKSLYNMVTGGGHLRVKTTYGGPGSLGTGLMNLTGAPFAKGMLDVGGWLYGVYEGDTKKADAAVQLGKNRVRFKQGAFGLGKLEHLSISQDLLNKIGSMSQEEQDKIKASIISETKAKDLAIISGSGTELDYEKSSLISMLTQMTARDYIGYDKKTGAAYNIEGIASRAIRAVGMKAGTDRTRFMDVHGGRLRAAGLLPTKNRSMVQILREGDTKDGAALQDFFKEEGIIGVNRDRMRKFFEMFNIVGDDPVLDMQSLTNEQLNSMISEFGSVRAAVSSEFGIQEDRITAGFLKSNKKAAYMFGSAQFEKLFPQVATMEGQMQLKTNDLLGGIKDVLETRLPLPKEPK